MFCLVRYNSGLNYILKDNYSKLKETLFILLRWGYMVLFDSFGICVIPFLVF